MQGLRSVGEAGRRRGRQGLGEVGSVGWGIVGRLSSSGGGARLSPESRRAQLVDVAARLLADDGLDALTVPRVARAAGVARALVYHYFPGRDALLEALWRREAAALLDATALDPDVPVRTNLERALGAYLDHFAASSGALRELYAPGAATPPVVRDLAEANHAVQVARVLAAFDLPATPQRRLAARGWLALVEEVARSGEAGGAGGVGASDGIGGAGATDGTGGAGATDASHGVTRTEALALCCDALEALLGVSLDALGPPEGPASVDEAARPHSPSTPIQVRSHP